MEACGSTHNLYRRISFSTPVFASPPTMAFENCGTLQTDGNWTQYQCTTIYRIRNAGGALSFLGYVVPHAAAIAAPSTAACGGPKKPQHSPILTNPGVFFITACSLPSFSFPTDVSSSSVPSGWEGGKPAPTANVLAEFSYVALDCVQTLAVRLCSKTTHNVVFSFIFLSSSPKPIASRYRNFNQRLVMWLSIAALIGSWSYFVGDSHSRYGGYVHPNQFQLSI